MKDGWLKVAAVTPRVFVADPARNTKTNCQAILKAAEQGAKIIALPALSLTSASCSDLFLQPTLQNAALDALKEICVETKEVDALIFVSLPFAFGGNLYAVGAALCKGKVLGIVPKAALSDKESQYDSRVFSPAPKENTTVKLFGEAVPFGSNLIFACESMPQVKVGLSLSEAVGPTRQEYALASSGASILCRLSAGGEYVSAAERRRLTASSLSAALVCGFVLAEAGIGESTADGVFGGHDMIFEAGRCLAEAKPFGEGFALSEIDCTKLSFLRQKEGTFVENNLQTVSFDLNLSKTTLTRKVKKLAFLPERDCKKAERCQEILAMQSHALAGRLAHIGQPKVILGLSGGLDSTLALLVAVRAMDLAKVERSSVVAVTMPGFGTTDRTYQNAVNLAKELGVTLQEISIAAAVTQHFADIGHDPSLHDVTYENAQARERTQILMDLANRLGGLVLGTGDLSELALGWATYNGDHMSMYGINASIPKTVVRHLVAEEAKNASDNVAAILKDILDTPVSPELLPAKDNEITQKTEDLVGPYELHDFFLYHFFRGAASPTKLFRLATHAFADEYDAATIKKWLVIFLRRFFAQQFKRSCMPDGPKIGSVCLSPRSDWRMVSDASSKIWLAEANAIEIDQ